MNARPDRRASGGGCGRCPINRCWPAPRETRWSSRWAPPAASAGFTIVEAMLAIVLLCTGLLAAAALGTASLHSWRRAGDLAAAVAAAGEIADSLALFGASDGGTRRYPWGVLVWDDPVPLGGSLLRVVIRASAHDSTRAELLRVTATVPTP